MKVWHIILLIAVVFVAYVLWKKHGTKIKSYVGS